MVEGAPGQRRAFELGREIETPPGAVATIRSRCSALIFEVGATVCGSPACRHSQEAAVLGSGQTRSF